MSAKIVIIDSPADVREDNDDSKSIDSIGFGKLFAFAVLSDSFFILGSILYIWLAVIGIEYEQQKATIPEDVWALSSYASGGDDDYWFYRNVTDCCSHYEDDYIIQGPWISKYQIVYFFASICFVFCGTFASFLPGGRWHVLLSIIFIGASCCGVASAVLIESNEPMSKKFNATSVHVYLIDGIGLAYARMKNLGRNTKMTKWKWYMLFGDFSFALGSGLDVAQSWFWLLSSESVGVEYLGLACAIFWLLCALIYATETFAWEFDCLHDGDYSVDGETDDYISGERTLSIEQTPVKIMNMQQKSDPAKQKDENSYEISSCEISSNDTSSGVGEMEC